MRTLVAAFIVLVLIHVIAAVSGIAWLAGSGRLSGERFARVAEIFKPTLAEDQAAAEAEALTLEEQGVVAEQQAWDELVSVGSGTLADMMAAQWSSGQVAMQERERLRLDTEQLLEQMTLFRRGFEDEKAAFDAARETFEREAAAQITRLEDEDFLQAVSMFEKMDPGQVKLIFNEMIREDRMPKVVDYLASMKMRSAISILSEFDGPDEVPLVEDLMTRIEARRAGPLRDAVELSENLP